jgi:exportin-T
MEIQCEDGFIKPSLSRATCTAYTPEVRFWCLQTLAECCRVHLPSLDPNDAAQLRSAVAGWVHEACVRSDPPVPPFIKNKLAQVTALMVRHEYPARWPRFFHELIGLLGGGGVGAADVFCRVLDAVDDEVISTGDTLLHMQGGGGILGRVGHFSQ